jgi:release factor glutamine methyltransferase
LSVGAQTLAGLSREVRNRFEEAGLDDPALEARILISGLLGLSSTELVTRAGEPVDDEQTDRVQAAAARRLLHEPVHRILGEREFYGLPLALSPETLEPRPDTEILVDSVLVHARRLASANGHIHILDIGTGTGAICLALLSECPEAAGTGSDISRQALETAKKNAGRNGLASRFQTVHSDWFESISGRYHVIVSNPPYIPSGVIETLEPEVRMFDPAAALDGGPDGLDAYRAIALNSGRFLHDEGVLGVEIGHDQRVAVTAIFEAQGFVLVEAARDYGHRDRVLVFQWRRQK